MSSTINSGHLFLLLITSTQNALLWKAFASFSGYIHTYYGFSYTALTSGLSIATLTTLITLFINPRLTWINTNWLIFLIQLCQIIGILLIWLVRSSLIIFLIGLSLLLNVFQIHWGVTNMIMSTFIKTEDIRRQYLSIYNSNWTLATFLFILTGYILRYYSYWIFLKIMLCSSITFAVANAFFMPKISVKHQNTINSNIAKGEKEGENNLSLLDEDQIVTTSMREDLKILFIDNKIYRILFGVVLLQFAIWGIFYVTFGPFIQKEFGLNTAEFGVISALIEGCANCAAITSLYIFKTERIVIFSGIVEFISILLLVMILNISGLTFLLDLRYQYLIYFIIFLFFVGNEGVVVGIMILNVQIAPSQQQARASGLISFGNSITNFISILIAGPLYIYAGMAIESIILLILIALECGLIVWFYAMDSNRKKRETMMINIRSPTNYKTCK